MESDEAGSDEEVPLNGTAPIATMRLAQLATRDNIVVTIASVIALDYFGLLSIALAAVPC